MFEREHSCPTCGSSLVKRSRQRGIVERYFIPILSLRPYRCRECYTRFYASRMHRRDSQVAA